MQSNFNNFFIRPSQMTEKKSWACLVPWKPTTLSSFKVKRKIFSEVQVLPGNYSSSALFSLRQQDTTWSLWASCGVIWVKFNGLWYTRGQTRGCNWEKDNLKVGRTRQVDLIFHMCMVKWSTLENTAQLIELVVNPLNFPFFCVPKENICSI